MKRNFGIYRNSETGYKGTQDGDEHGDETMRSEIQAIKTVKQAKRVYAAISAQYTSMVSADHFDHADYMFRTSTFYKENGIAWWRDRCLSMAENIVRKSSKEAKFIPPSPETLAWGGFLGGETVTITDKGKEANATSLVLGLIAAA